MKILLLGNSNKLETFLINQGNQVHVIDSVINLDNDIMKFDLIISFKYRHIINSDIIKYFNKRLINLHISYLPWNRGAHPNLWSFLDNTKKGVTIHEMTDKLDSGPIIYQAEIKYTSEDTLYTSYNRLNISLENLFINNWEKIYTNNYKSFIPIECGSYNSLKKFSTVKHLLKNGWNTKVIDILGMGKKI